MVELKRNKAFKFVGIQLTVEEVLILIAPLLIIGIYSGLALLGVVRSGFTIDSLVHWDTGWYNSIRGHGYVFIEGEQCNTAFFPFFPYLWKVSHLSVVGIGFLNAAFYGIGALLLKRAIDLDSRRFWLLFLNPAACFMHIAYSEALFFFGIALATFGFKRTSLTPLIIGVVIACLTRSISAFFIAGGIVAMFLTRDRWKQLKPNIIFLVMAGVSLLAVILFQYSETEVWMAFSKPQKHWDHFIQIPTFPFTIGSRWSFWLDGTSLAFASVAVLYFAIQVVREKFNVTMDFIEILSYGYLGFIVVFMLFIQGGGLISVGRYVLANPFIWIVVSTFQVKKIKPFAFLMIGILVLFMVTIDGGVFTYFEHPLFLFRDLLFFLLLWLVTVGSSFLLKSNKWIWGLIMTLNVVALFHFMELFLVGKWVG